VLVAKDAPELVYAVISRSGRRAPAWACATRVALRPQLSARAGTWTTGRTSIVPTRAAGILAA